MEPLRRRPSSGLEQERERLIAEKIEKGEAVRAPPLVVGGPDEIDAARARETAALRKAGETRDIVFGDGETEFIVTSVPRSARGQAQAPNVSEPDKKGPQRRLEGEALRLREGDPLCYVPHAPAPEETPSDPIPIMATLRSPDERDPAGVIARGYYRHTPTKVRVYDTEGALLGAADLRPGDDVEVAARKLLKEKCGGTGFYGPPLILSPVDALNNSAASSVSPQSPAALCARLGSSRRISSLQSVAINRSLTMVGDEEGVIIRQIGTFQMDQSLENRIRERAYEIWTAHGCVHGQADQHWLAAEREILAASTPALAREPAPKKRRRSSVRSKAARVLALAG